MVAIESTDLYMGTKQKYNVSVSSQIIDKRSLSGEDDDHFMDFDVDEATEAISFERITNGLTFVPKNNRLYSFWNFCISIVSFVQTIMYAVFAGWGI